MFHKLFLLSLFLLGITAVSFAQPSAELDAYLAHCNSFPFGDLRLPLRDEPANGFL